MNCSACGYNEPNTQATQCPVCGFATAKFQAVKLRIYLVTSAFFLTVLTYAVVVFLLPLSQNPVMPDSDLLLYVGGGTSAVLLAIMLQGPPVPEMTAPQRALRQVVVHAALAETPALIGLVIYLLSGRLSHFVILLGGSLLLFMILATRVPRLVQAIRKYMVYEFQTRKH